jgi:hypothetical protein
MPTRMVGAWLLLGMTVLAGPAHAAEPAETAGIEFFEKKVRPLLVANCYPCHSADQKVRGGLQLDSRDALLKGGDNGAVVVPGDPEKSRLVQAIRYADMLRMPPRSKLPDEAIADLTAWVKMGAPFPQGGSTVKKTGPLDIEALKKHWSFQPIRRPTVPAVKDATWPRNPIDAFLLATLEKEGLRPAPPAEPRVWLRRVTFDLTGLPPTPDEITAFEQSAIRNPQSAMEQVVDRLLASPAYGERWARHWLDLVRFAETSGHEFDFEIPDAYLYRDYLIRAINADVPYDQIVREHIAGDLLTPRRHPITGINESVLGTAFWFLGESKHSPVDVRADGADRRDNMIDVFGKAFLGLTVACARCHDHKFDPIPQADYYALAGYLQSSRYERVFLDLPETFAGPIQEIRSLRDQANKLARTQSAKVLTARLAKLPGALLSLREGKAPAEVSRAWQASDVNRPDHPFYPWTRLMSAKDDKAFAAAREQLRAEVSRKPDRAGDIVFADFQPENYARWYRSGFAFADRPSGVNDLSLAPEKPVPATWVRGPHAADSGATSNRLQGAIRSPSFTIERNSILYRVAGKGARFNLIIDGFEQIRDPIYGGLTFTVDHGDGYRWHSQNVSMWKGLRAYIEVLDDGDGFAALDRVVFSDHGAPPPEIHPAFAELLADDSASSPEKFANRLASFFREVVVAWQADKLAPERVAILNGLLQTTLLAALGNDESPDKELPALVHRLAELEARLPTPQRGLGMRDGSGEDENLYIRGNHKTLGDPVPRHFLVALAGKDQPVPTAGSGRLEMASRLLSPANPLPARVLVNRLWQHHFGRGIVGSVDNFGIQGQLPTHPELLDWLADEFVRSGWSMKAMHRLMVLSSAYRMSSQGDPMADTKDAGNRLWHKMPVRRLEAEAIRDAMLSVSGRLDLRMYGRGPLPFLTEHMQGRGRPLSGPLDGQGRRSIYLNVRRNFINPMFLAFDYPVPFSTMGQRTVSNVPAQALTLLNNPFVVSEARRWAERVLVIPGTTEERIGRMYLAAFGRKPTPDEVREATDFLTTQAKEYGKADDVRAWADLAHVLFNVKDFIFVE